jgi:Zn-dependent protease
MDRRRKLIGWALFLGIFAAAFIVSLGVGLATHSLSAAKISYFVALPIFGLAGTAVLRKKLPTKRVAGIGPIALGGSALITVILVVGQLMNHDLGLVCLPISVVLVILMSREAKSRQQAVRQTEAREHR